MAAAKLNPKTKKNAPFEHLNSIFMPLFVDFTFSTDLYLHFYVSERANNKMTCSNHSGS
jgi:hypothetical protein